MYDIKNSAGAGYNSYSRIPEFLQDLDDLLKINLVTEFRAESHSYVALCRIPIDKVLFCSTINSINFEEKYVYYALYYIWEYYYSVWPCGMNPKLRVLDDYKVSVEKWIKVEQIMSLEWK